MKKRKKKKRKRKKKKRGGLSMSCLLDLLSFALGIVSRQSSHLCIVHRFRRQSVCSLSSILSSRFLRGEAWSKSFDFVKLLSIGFHLGLGEHKNSAV